MLVLGRMLNERIYIGEDVIVTVVEIRGGLVKLGIDAPKSVAVHREEVLRRIQNEQNWHDHHGDAQ